MKKKKKKKKMKEAELVFFAHQGSMAHADCIDTRLGSMSSFSSGHQVDDLDNLGLVEGMAGVEGGRALFCAIFKISRDNRLG